MNRYQYSYLDQNQGGQKRTGIIEAQTEQAALRKLYDDGLTPLRVKKMRESKNVEDFFNKGKPIKVETKAVFARQFASMFAAGVPPLRILTTLTAMEPNVKFKDILADVTVRVQDGESLSQALAHHPETFDDLFCGMVRAGEEGGKLDESLKALATQLEKDVKLKRAIKSATMYPKIVLFFVLFLLALILGWMVPKFLKIFKEVIEQTADTGATADTSIPAPTLIVQKVGSILYPQYGETMTYMNKLSFGYTSGFEKQQKFLAFVVELGLRAAVVFAIFVFVRYLIRIAKRNPEFHYRWDRIKLRAPLKIGPLVQKIAVARFARSLSSMLKSGIPAAKAMELTADTAGNRVVAEAILNARKSLLNGDPMVDALKNSDGAFPLTMCAMVETGEESGNIEEMLIYVADDYEEQVDSQIKALNSIIEPLMLIIVGAIVGVIVISIYLPMFAIYNRIGQGGGPKANQPAQKAPAQPGGKTEGDAPPPQTPAAPQQTP